MAIYTPRGLKIRLDINYAFALIQRLYPKVDAFKILKTTEGLESIPGLFAFIVGLYSFYIGLNPYEITFYTIIASITGGMLTTIGLFVVPGLVKLGIIYSYISGFGFLLMVIVIWGYFSVGWQGVIAFLIGNLISFILNELFIGLLNTKIIYSKIGVPLTKGEINFLNAYRINADNIGKSTDINVSEDELKEDNWKECFEDLYIKYPEVVNRFTKD